MKLAKTHRQIPTLKLSKSLLEDLCKTLDSEYEKVKENNTESDPYGVEYNFSNSESDVSEKDSKLFLDNVPIEIGKIEMSLTSKKGDVNIEISNTEFYDWNRFSVSGEDSTWVFGITKRLEQLFHRYKTNNHIFHTKKGWGIYVLCAIGLFFSIFLPLSHAQLIPPESNGLPVVAAVMAFMPSAMSIPSVWPYVFKRAFPPLELENSPQSKFKNLIPVFIVGVFSSIIVSTVFLFIGHK